MYFQTTKSVILTHCSQIWSRQYSAYFYCHLLAK